MQRRQDCRTRAWVRTDLLLTSRHAIMALFSHSCPERPCTDSATAKSKQILLEGCSTFPVHPAVRFVQGTRAIRTITSMILALSLCNTCDVWDTGCCGRRIDAYCMDKQREHTPHAHMGNETTAGSFQEWYTFLVTYVSVVAVCKCRAVIRSFAADTLLSCQLCCSFLFRGRG